MYTICTKYAQYIFEITDNSRNKILAEQQMQNKVNRKKNNEKYV